NSADGTAFLWESRSPPFLLIKPQFIRIEVFLCHIIKGNELKLIPTSVWLKN
ncbi:MAG: hypothetical protein ACJA1B_002993, partial [Polaribacter sp.]